MGSLQRIEVCALPGDIPSPIRVDEWENAVRSKLQEVLYKEILTSSEHAESIFEGVA